MSVAIATEVPWLWTAELPKPVAFVPSRSIYQGSAIDYVGRFYKLVSQWRAETIFCSLVRDKINNPAFQQIVDMKDLAVPLIIRELQIQPDFLFLALHAITGENPVPSAAAGKPNEIVEAWLSWAQRNKINAA